MNSKHRKTVTGFTLVELVMVLAVMALLAGIAYPSYLQQTAKGRRAEAVAALLKTSAKQEKYFADHGSYADDMRALGYSADPYVTEHGFYRIDATLSSNGQRYLLTATRAGSASGDTLCGDLTFSSLSVRAATNHSDSDPAAHCW